MSERLAAAEAALQAGKSAEAIEHLTAAIAEDPARPLQVYRALVVQLYRLGRHAEGEVWSARALEHFPKSYELWNIRGVFLRQLKRYPEALQALDEAWKVSNGNVAPLVNRGNIYLDIEEPAKAEAIFSKLVRQDPRNSEFQRQYGRSLLKQGNRDQALVRLRQAVALKKDFLDAWLDMVGLFNDEGRADKAGDMLEKALAANPDHPRLLEAKAIVMRRAGQLRRAEAYLHGLLPQHENAAWLQYQLGAVIAEHDRDRGNEHLRRAVELAPGKREYLMALIESLERTRTGDEGAHIEESYQLTKTVLAEKPNDLTPSAKKIINEVLVRVCAFDELPLLGDFASVGREWASSGRHTALLKQLARVESMEDRLELLEQHRIWGRDVEARAAARPIRKPAPRPKGGKIRLGFLSSDLRRHPVGYFALPLFEHVDRERFELFCYSFYLGQLDPVQQFITDQVEAYRWKPDTTSRDAAQMIADDQLDMLIELGGSTHMNKLDVMAYRPAPKQASWLGYPHSAGLSSIDYLICDPYTVPPNRELLVEEPLLMPSTWIALGRMVFSDAYPINPELPEARKGHITFGTANNPHKYNRAMVQTWARVLLATPGSKFLFIRPEGGTASFRENLQAEFEAAGVSRDRIEFNAVRGRHMPVYNEVDITLDTFPLTGGTTTTETLWMGVPVVSLMGEAFFERLSASIMTNAGVGDLATTNLDDYVRIATELAADRPRRQALRTGLRQQMQSGPLGQTEQFARDFYDLIARTVRG